MLQTVTALTFDLTQDPIRGKTRMTLGKKRAALKIAVLAALVLCAAPPVTTWGAPAKEKGYEKGELLRMDSSSCGTAEGGGKTIAGEILGTGGNHKKTQEILCQDYVLRTDRMIYRIRPKNNKHPILLPVGEAAEFRIHKDAMYLRVPESPDTKEKEYIVLSVAPRSEDAESDNRGPGRGRE